MFFSHLICNIFIINKFTSTVTLQGLPRIRKFVLLSVLQRAVNTRKRTMPTCEVNFHLTGSFLRFKKILELGIYDVYISTIISLLKEKCLTIMPRGFVYVQV